MLCHGHHDHHSLTKVKPFFFPSFTFFFLFLSGYLEVLGKKREDMQLKMLKIYAFSQKPNSGYAFLCSILLELTQLCGFIEVKTKEP